MKFLQKSRVISTQACVINIHQDNDHINIMWVIFLSFSGITFKSASVVKVQSSFTVLEPFLTWTYRTKSLFVTRHLSIVNTSVNLLTELIEGKRCLNKSINHKQETDHTHLLPTLSRTRTGVNNFTFVPTVYHTTLLSYSDSPLEQCGSCAPDSILFLFSITEKTRVKERK